MGSTVYGQLGNPTADGKLPCLASNDSVEEVACGAYHVAVLTSRNEVFTWGKGANGRLGHGDVEDRNAPTLVEALKERHVKYIACGANFTAAICLHKWASGAEQTQCSACKQAFGFTKKSHNCYNCGLVHCHSCSSKKSLKASLAPNPGKPYRVCDSCYSKLSKASEASSVMPRLSGENKDRLDKAELRLAKSGIPSKIDLIKQLDSRAARQGRKGETFSLVRTSQTPLLQLRDAFSNVAELRRGPPKPAVTPSGGSSRSVSPFSRRSSPTRSVTPIPSTVGLGFSTSITESLKKTNELLNQEVVRLRAQAESLRQRCEVQELEVQKSVKKAQEAMKLASEETAKSEAAKEVIKSLTTQDRNAPTLVEALKERHVKYIACGANFTAAICLHKWASGAEQTQCSACKQAFGFTKKSHNCYNCGLVHCHSCSSKKSLKASLAPNPGKPYRVCDSCYSKLSKASEASSVMPRLSGENKDRLDKAELRLAKSGIPSKIDLIKQLDSRAARQGRKGETFSLVRTSQTPLLQLRDALSNVADLRRVPPKPAVAVTPSGGNSRSVSPFSRRSSPTRSVTPIPSMAGIGFSTSVTESLKKTNELLNQDVAESLRQRCEVQELEVQKSLKKAQEAMKQASEESAKSEAAKEVIKSLTTQLKDIVKLLPPGAHEAETARTTNLLKGFEQNGIHFANAKGQRSSRSDSMSDTPLASPLTPPSRSVNGLWRSSQSPRNTDELQSDGVRISNGFSEDGDTRRNSRSSVATSNASQVEAEWIEQYEPGVYITLLALGDGTRDLKRVRFSRRRFKEQQAEAWWTENRERVYEKYKIRGTDRPSVQSQFQT
ncbi:hypothetical protein F2Q70_00045199 [Brassica cretica]|uniref:FYVE-type domain-containing protein n=1 Tax=Brassica cretica TaxID=69181 RepID=A0A8S9KL81_BRACR|nr:hypothetical protein F2Q70_00045199 [Brassica cretica]